MSHLYITADAQTCAAEGKRTLQRRINPTRSLKMQARSAEIDSRASASNWAGLNLIYIGIKGCSFFQVESAAKVKKLRCLPIKNMSIGANGLLMAQTASVKVDPTTADDMVSTDTPVATTMARSRVCKAWKVSVANVRYVNRPGGLGLSLFLR